MQDEPPFSLRRDNGFYIFLAIVVAAVVAFITIVSVLKSVGLPWVGLLLLVIFLGLAAIISYSYRIEWDGRHIVQRAFLSKDVRIAAEDLAFASRETSGFGEAAQMRRPFQRVVLYGKSESGAQACIDISLKGFKRSDIEKLLVLIAARRPDLKIPKL